jgi:hypothetical protein
MEPMKSKAIRMASAVILAGLASCAPARIPDARESLRPVASQAPPPTVAAPAQVSFEGQIRPVLEARCQPCHFPGGTMYERLPFDQPATIHTLGEKLFTRIKDEKERALFRSFLAREQALPARQAAGS